MLSHELRYEKNGKRYVAEMYRENMDEVPYLIEWMETDATNASGMVEHIGLVFEGNVLVDYDGISFDLPRRFRDWIRSLGFEISKDLYDDEPKNGKKTAKPICYECKVDWVEASFVSPTVTYWCPDCGQDYGQDREDRGRTMKEKAKIIFGVFVVWLVSFSCGYWYAATKADQACRDAVQKYYGGYTQ